MLFVTLPCSAPLSNPAACVPPPSSPASFWPALLTVYLHGLRLALWSYPIQRKLLKLCCPAFLTGVDPSDAVGEPGPSDTGFGAVSVISVIMKATEYAARPGERAAACC